MSLQTVCDECGEVIDQTLPHYQLSGSKVKLDETGLMTVVEPAVTLHYHAEHLPVYKIEGKPVEGLPAPAHPIVETDDSTPVGPAEPAPEEEPDPYPDTDIGTMTVDQVVNWALDDRDKLEYALAEEMEGEHRSTLLAKLHAKLEELDQAPEVEEPPEG